MIDGLAAVGTGVDDDSKAFGQLFSTGNFRSGTHEVTEQGTIILAAIGKRADVLARSDEHVDRGCRMNVGKGITLVVLVDGGGGNASVNDFAKKAAHGETSVQERQLV
jgi:hypothetical protein